MANLKYSDKHNMVFLLKKPNKSVGFTEVVDFLKVRTLANGTQQLVASIDSKEYTITEASVRSKLQLADATGIHNLSNAEIYAELATLGGYAGDIVHLPSAILAGAVVDQGEGSAQPAKPYHTPVNPISSTSQPPIPSPPHPSPPPYSPPHSPLHSPPHLPHQSPPFSPPYFLPPRSYEAPLPEGNTSGSVEASMQLSFFGLSIYEREVKQILSLLQKAFMGGSRKKEISPTILGQLKRVQMLLLRVFARGQNGKENAPMLEEIPRLLINLRTNETRGSWIGRGYKVAS
ncbi:hypothetical protein Tco_1353898 [Tanacetum coccineum]